jgi:hypothetical protein
VDSIFLLLCTARRGFSVFFFSSEFLQKRYLKIEIGSAVKPVYNGHPWDLKIVVFVHRWPLFRGFQSKLLLNLIWPGLGWPLLAGGRSSEVAVNTGLTVLSYMSMAANLGREGRV